MNRRTPQSELMGRIPAIHKLLNPIAVFILATIFVFWDASRAAYVLASLAAMVLLLRYRPRVPGDLWLYSWPIVAYVGAAFLSVVFNDFTDSGTNKLVSRYFLLLLAIPLAVLFYVAYDARRNIWIAFAVGCIVMGGLALFDNLVLGIKASGELNSSVFGFAAVVMTAVLVTSYRFFSHSAFGRYLYYFALAMGVCATLLSESRTTWVAGLAILVIAVFFFLDRYSKLKRAVIALALICGLAILAGSLPVVQKRMVRLVENFTPYVMGEEQSEFNSLRERVELWKLGWHLGLENRVFGFGPGNTKRVIRNHIQQNPQLAGLGEKTHIHNQFLQSFAMTGLVGLVSLLAMLACHFWIFIKYLGKAYSPEVRSLALAGFLLLLAYLLKSFPGVPFYGKQYLMVYGLASAILCGSLLGALRASLPR